MLPCTRLTGLDVSVTRRRASLDISMRLFSDIRIWLIMKTVLPCLRSRQAPELHPCHPHHLKCALQLRGLCRAQHPGMTKLFRDCMLTGWFTVKLIYSGLLNVCGLYLLLLFAGMEPISPNTKDVKCVLVVSYSSRETSGNVFECDFRYLRGFSGKPVGDVGWETRREQERDRLT